MINRKGEIMRNMSNDHVGVQLISGRATTCCLHIDRITPPLGWWDIRCLFRLWRSSSSSVFHIQCNKKEHWFKLTTLDFLLNRVEILA